MSFDCACADVIPHSTFRIPQWIRAQSLDLGRQLGGGERKLAAHGRRQIDHLHTLAFQTDLLQQLLRVFDSPSGVEIT